MRAIILAAGRGTRMREFTDHRPKCFTEIQGKPLLDWQLEALKGAGIRQVSVVCGYRRELFQRKDLTYFYNPCWSQTNMVASLTCAAEWLLEEPCIVSYSDIIYSSSAVKLLAKATDNIVITYDPNWLKIWSLRFQDPLSDAETFRIDQNQILLEIGRKPAFEKEIQGQFMGLVSFTPEGWKCAKKVLSQMSRAESDRLDMTHLLNKLIMNSVKIHAVPISDFWFEIDNPNDTELCSRMMMDRP